MSCNLWLNHVFEPTLGVTNVYYRVRAVIDDSLFPQAHTLRSMHHTRATLRREQLYRAQCTLCAERIATRDAAPQHDVDASENLPGQLIRIRCPQ